MESSKNKRIKEVSKNDIWNKDKMKRLRDFIISESEKQSPERKLRNELLSIRYQIEEYINKDQVEKEMKIIDFVKLYLESLDITQKKLANVFEMNQSNLHKYLKGERRMNPDLACKLSSFSHTKPELWYFVQAKNELLHLKNRSKAEDYEKYNYEKLISE